MEIRGWSVRSLSLLILVGAVFTPIVAVVLDVFGVLTLVSDGFPVDIATFANLVGAFGSVTLTLALVLLYREQTTIQQQQEEWMEAEHVPDVFVNEWVVTRDRIELELSNLGTGVARNLRVKIVAETRDPIAVSRVTLAARVTREPSSAQVLRPDENNNTTMTGYFGFDDADANIDTTAMDVEQALIWLKAETRPIDTTVRISYDYVRRRSGSQHVFSCVVEPEDATTVEGLLFTADKYSDGLDTTPPTNLHGANEVL